MLATFETRCEKFESLNIVLPFAGGGNLYDFLRIENDNRWHQRSYPVSDPSMPGSLADWRYAVYRETAGIADALKVLHENRNGTFIMHCDIKPANILIQKGVFKLADFGLSKLKDSEDSSKTDWYRGTALYSPPERESSTGVGRGRDVWAFGCVLLEIALMIRFAFQREVKFISPDVNNYIDSFELERRRHSRQHGDIETAIYHKTMVCVRWEMNRFDGMRPGLRHRITRDGLLPIIRDMLQEDPRNRCTAAEAAARLSSHYLGLQADTQLQRPFEYQDNPGGPPADWDGRHSYGSEDNSNPRRSAILQNPEYGPCSRPELLRTATAPAGTSGSGDEMVAMDVEGVKRPASSTEPKSHPPPFQSKEHSSIDIFLRPNINIRHSSMGDESAAKRRRIDDTN
jgi:serine/threonine protein kinase